MDPLTHTATGIFLSRAGLNRLTPRALPILILAANAPDIDIVAATRGSLNYLHYHRHITHSLVALPVLAALTVGIVALAGRKHVFWPGAFLAACIAVASHLLLDLTNMYGVRLLLPFSARWLQLDLTPVVDIWIWSAIAVGFAAPFLARLVTSEIASGKPRARTHGRGVSWCALLFLLAYNGGRAVLHNRSLAILNSRLYNGAVPIRAAALPDQNPLQWHGIIETDRFYALEEVNLASRFDPGRGQLLDKATPDAALEAARRTSAFQTFLGFSRFPLWRVFSVPEPESAREVRLLDLRFGTPANPGFMTTALVGGNGQVLETRFQFGPARPR